MKVENMVLKSFSVVMVMSVLILSSCFKSNETLNASEVEIISTESLSEACVAEASEMSIVILGGLSDSQLGSIPASIQDFSLIDSLLAGASIVVSGTGGMNAPQGTITIDFKKTGTADRNGVVRKGVVKINYVGRRWAVGSTRSISFSGYSRNNVKLDDSTSYTITNLTDSTLTTREFHHVLTKCKFTFPDQRTFIRSADFIASVNFISKTTTLLTDSDAYGTNPYSPDFNMKIAITDSLVYKPQCIGAKMYLPNKGTKKITVGSSNYIVTYGNSTLTCGRTVTVNAGDKTTAITINSDGN